MRTTVGVTLVAMLGWFGCARSDWIDRTLVTVDTVQVAPLNVLVEGTVSGDVFSFRQTNGSVEGSMRVSGDEMTGEIANAPWGRLAITLQRVK